MSDQNASSTTQTPPADPPPPAQDTGPPVDSTPPATSTDTPSSTSGQGSPTDTTTGATSASDPSNDVSSSDPKKASPSKAGSDPTPSGTSDAIPAAPVAPTALSQGPPLPGATPADQVWVEQWSAFTREDVTGTLRAGLKPAIRLALGRAGGFVFFPTSKAKRIEARERQRGETAKASALRPGLTASGATGPGAGLFDLFTGGGGGGATVTIYIFLGILAVTLLPIPSRTTAFRLPAVSWRPSEYVPPIEQPG